MGINTVPMRTFLGAMEKWVRAVGERRTEDARFFAHQIEAGAKLLAFDPEFKAIFADNRDTCTHQDPTEVLACIQAFIQAVTDAGQAGRYRPSSDEPQRP